MVASSYPESLVFGFDVDSLSLETSTESAKELKNLQTSFWEFGSDEQPVEAPFDFIFIRFLLLHVSNPLERLKSLISCLNKDAVLYVVDLDDSVTELNICSWHASGVA